MNNLDFREGINYFDIGIEKSNPKDLDIWHFYMRGQSYYDLKEYEEALDDFFTFNLFKLISRCLQIDNTKSNIYHRIGNVYHSMRNYEEAIKYYDECVRIIPIWINNSSIRNCISKLETL
jgi:tetratricopeptide (TPR) repeat protein